VVRKVTTVNLPSMRAYVELLRSLAKGPADRFLLNRIEGLERLIALK
jgi:hypothetical protein